MRMLLVKFLETLMLLYQYIYYTMRCWDGQLRLPAWVTQCKAFVVYMVLEVFVVTTVYVLVAHKMSGHKILSRDFEISSFEIRCIIGASILYFLNQKILGSDKQIQHYKKIFDDWDKGRRMRWKFYVISIMISIAATFLLTIQVDQFGLNPKNWNFN